MTERPLVLIVGSGFAGFHAARALERRLPEEAAEIVLVSPVDHLLYTSLLPQVAAGVVEPRHLAVGLRNALRRTRVQIGHVVAVDLDGRTVRLRNRDGTVVDQPWDRLALAPGAVTRTLDIPGVPEHAHGLKTLAEAVALRDHVLRELEHADAAGDGSDPDSCCTFVVVGAGYTGTELAAQLRSLTTSAAEHFPRLRADRIRWLLVDLADRVLPDLPERLGARALAVLRERGVEVRLGTTVRSATADSVTLSDGTVVGTHTLVWTAGVTPSPLIATLGLPTTRGRLQVDARFGVPGRPDVFALGDAAAVPDLTGDEGALTGQTAQHAQRQGRVVAQNVAASLGHGRARDYRHRDLGFVVDLGGLAAVADPLHVPLSGLPAAAVTRGYHLLALPTAGKRLRVGLDWLVEACAPPQFTQLGFVPDDEWSLHAAAEDGAGADGAGPEWRRAAGDVPRRTVGIGDPALISGSAPTPAGDRSPA